MFRYPRSSTFTSIIGKCAILKLLSHYEELRQDLAKNTQINMLKINSFEYCSSACFGLLAFSLKSFLAYLCYCPRNVLRATEECLMLVLVSLQM